MAQKVQFDVGLILDSGSLVGKMSNTSISMAIEDFYESHPDYTTRVVLTAETPTWTLLAPPLQRLTCTYEYSEEGYCIQSGNKRI
ncbi:Glutamate receptor 1.2 [Acorus calamus]|uniref:Glutamate receptor 1.2 n=1 Tax=Acorus calamus TaxID=4465 RepID=A0AAV9EUM0_ACOCL|nr:Glutamate receptor 1.2 [Acorus calamus]